VGRKLTVDPAEVAHELMGTLAKAEITETGWTNETVKDMESTLKLPWHTDAPNFCDDDQHAECVAEGWCGQNHNSRGADQLRKCRRVCYRQTRTVMEV